MSPGYLVRSCLAITAFFLAGCSTPPEIEQHIQARQARIDAILKTASPRIASERCLNSSQYHHVRVLDNRRILFEGRRDQYWLNVLPARCSGLQSGDALRVERISGQRLCQFDSLYPLEWFAWPWYRRWPWYWNSGPKCTLGEFLPLTSDQVQQLDSTFDASSN
jgi:hypothetical protein